jgi:hypothetical protein
MQYLLQISELKYKLHSLKTGEKSSLLKGGIKISRLAEFAYIIYNRSHINVR